MPAVGTNQLTALARHYILPQVTDNAYLKNNALLYRMIRGNKRMLQGGTQIEVPMMYRRFGGGSGTYRGYELLNTVPQDTIKNSFVEWKQHYASFAVDGLTLIRADSPLAIANHLNIQSQQMFMEMAENLAVGIYSNGITDPKDIDGLRAIVEDGNTYAGFNRAVETWFQAKLDSATTTLTLSKMHGLFSDATIGATHPTIWFGNGVNYNRLYALMVNPTAGYQVQYTREPGGSDELLAQAGFTNLMMENVPFVRDDQALDPDIYALNENFFALVVSPRADFVLKEFKEPHNQDAYISTLVWAGNMICMNARAQARFDALNA